MVIESKISGWAISDCEITMFPHFRDCIVTLNDIDNLSARSAQWIFDNYNLVELNRELTGCNFGVLMRRDDMYKVSIMEYYPEIEAQLIEYFNDIFGDWRKCYLRFFH